MKSKKVFISSRLGELKEERDAVEAAISDLWNNEKLPIQVWRWEKAPSIPTTKKPDEVQSQGLKESNIYLLIIGSEYGNFEYGKSSTHKEYNEATSSGSFDKDKILIYVKEFEKGERDVKVQKWINSIEEDSTIKKFKTPYDLKDSVKTRLRELVKPSLLDRLIDSVKKNKKKLFLGVLLIIIILIIPIKDSNVSVDDYAFPPWVDSKALQDPAKDKSIKWEYKIDSKGLLGYRLLDYRLLFVTVNLELEKEHNISNYIGISFSVKADKSINETNSDKIPQIEFLVHTNKDRGYIYWTGKNNKNMEISEEWMNKTILFSDLKIAHWTNDSKAPSEPNLKKIYALNFAAPTTTQRSNIIWFYDIKLVHKDGNQTSIATGNVPILAPEEPLQGKWTTPDHIPRLSIIDEGV